MVQWVKDACFVWVQCVEPIERWKENQFHRAVLWPLFMYHGTCAHTLIFYRNWFASSVYNELVTNTAEYMTRMNGFFYSVSDCGVFGCLGLLLLLLGCWLFAWDRVSLCSLGWPQTPRDPSSSPFWVLAVKECAIIPSPWLPLTASYSLMWGWWEVLLCMAIAYCM